MSFILDSFVTIAQLDKRYKIFLCFKPETLTYQYILWCFLSMVGTFKNSF